MADWTRDEVEAIVADCFAMLQAELSGQPYSKAEHNRGLQRRIGRNKGSIEFKHQNISAVLVNFRQPFIAGYLPRQNYQKLLEQVVLEWLSTEPRFFQRLSDGPVLMPRARPAIETGVRVTSLVEKPPEGVVDVDPGEAVERSARFYRTDFVRRDAENRQLGRLGEEWVVEFEQRRLHDEERRPDLARRVEWIADTRGDGAGYDIASFNPDASPRLIEVKSPRPLGSTSCTDHSASAADWRPPSIGRGPESDAEPAYRSAAGCRRSFRLVCARGRCHRRRRRCRVKARVDAEVIQRAVLRIRGQNVMLDSDLASLYRVDVKVLNQAVKRNRQRFPPDFMFQLNAGESASLRSQIVTASPGRDRERLRSQTVTLDGGRGRHRKYLPNAFTEQGVAMLSSVLRSPRAVRVNIEIMRAFVQLRRMLGANEELARKLDALEQKYDGQFRAVFQAIRELMTPSRRARRTIGFRGAGE